MIEDELRAHYAATKVNLDAQARLLSLLLDPPLRNRPTHRRNLRAGLAVSGSVAAVGALALVVVLIPKGSGSSSSPAAVGSATTSNVTTPTTSVAVSDSATAQLLPVTPQVVVQTLIELVSTKGTATNPAGRALDNTSAGEIVFNDGHGAAQIDVALTWKGTGPHDAVPTGCLPSASCTVMANGITVSTSQSLEYPADPSHPNNSTEWNVRAYRPSDGLEVDISEWNAPTEKDSPTSRPQPPFTLSELTAIATSPKWSATATSSAITAAAGLFVPQVMPTGHTTS